MGTRICKVVQPEGLVDYSRALEWQRSLARARASGDLADDTLILLEHPHVITLGRGASEANVIAGEALLRARSVEVHEVERGGDVTYHGPGQLVGYPIIDLGGHRRDLHWYLRQLEECLIRALTLFGVEAGRVPGLTGVWAEDRKIASIGVHVTRWVTFHGFALNVTTDLSYFDLIVPCGINAVKMTSLEAELGGPTNYERVRDAVSRSFGEVFGLDLEGAELTSLLPIGSLADQGP